MSMAHDEATEAVEYLLAVFPSNFAALVKEGATGDEVHRITGDDLAGACHSLQVIADYLGVDTTDSEASPTTAPPVTP